MKSVYRILFFLMIFIPGIFSSALAEGGAQFPVGSLYEYGGSYLCQYSGWCYYTQNGSWNAIYAYARHGESISVKNFGSGTVIYPNGASSNFSGSTTISASASNTPADGGIFEFRSSNRLGSDWDVTVKNSTGSSIAGRVYTYGLAFNMNNGIYSTLYTLTDEGIIFREQMRGGIPWEAFLVSTKRGLYLPETGNSVYHSKSQGSTEFRTAYPKAAFISQMPDYSMTDTVHKIFFNYPDSSLLAYLGLDNVLSGASVQNFKFTGSSEGYATPNSGGVFTFDADDVRGSWHIAINLGSDAKNINFSGVINKGSFSVYWDGKDKQGNYVPEGTYTTTLSTSVGETHFIIEDYETGGDGFIFTQMNGRNPGSNTVYYDNTGAVVGGIIIEASGDGDDRSVSGIDSSSGIFRNNTNAKTFDVWMKQNEYTYTKNITIATTKTIQITNSFVDYDNRWNLRPDSVFFDAFEAGSTSSAGSCTASASSSWKCDISGLSVGASYEIRERSVNGYTATTAAVQPGASYTSATIISTLVTKDINITKNFEDQDNRFSTRPTSIVFDVYMGSGSASIGNCTASPSDLWKCTVPALPKYDKNGDVIIYAVKERYSSNAYTTDNATIYASNGTAATITNTLITKNLTFTKVWRDNNNENSMRPQNITADVYLGDTLIDSCTASASTSWKCTVTGLAVYDSRGNARSYLAKERTVPLGYETSDVIVAGKDTTAVELINTLVVKDVPVIKNWVDNKDFDSNRPNSIALKLYRDGSEFRSAIMSAAAHQYSDNVWIYIFEDVPEYSASGSRAIYTVKEFPAN